MGALQPMHLIIVLVIILLIFGPGKLPELGRAVGDGMRELKRANSGEQPQPQPIPLAIASCPSCAASMPVHARFCGVCGSQAQAEPARAAVL
jgi:sec-independent protein translocase protein TatA